MARTNILDAVKRKDGKSILLSSRTDDFLETKELFKEFPGLKFSDEFSSVTYQESDGPARTVNFITGAEFEAQKKRKAADIAAFEAQKKSESEAKTKTKSK